MQVHSEALSQSLCSFLLRHSRTSYCVCRFLVWQSVLKMIVQLWLCPSFVYTDWLPFHLLKHEKKSLLQQELKLQFPDGLQGYLIDSLALAHKHCKNEGSLCIHVVFICCAVLHLQWLLDGGHLLNIWWKDTMKGRRSIPRHFSPSLAILKVPGDAVSEPPQCSSLVFKCVHTPWGLDRKSF